MKYSEFLNSKAASDIPTGFEPAGIKLDRPAFDFQRDVVNWAVRRGRAALFEDCGLGKTVQQLAWAQEIVPHAERVLILAPLAVERDGATVKHGGKRKGAGRKPTGRRPYLVRMKPRTMAVLKRAAKPKTVGEYLDATYAP